MRVRRKSRKRKWEDERSSTYFLSIFSLPGFFKPDQTPSRQSSMMQPYSAPQGRAHSGYYDPPAPVVFFYPFHCFPVAFPSFLPLTTVLFLLFSLDAVFFLNNKYRNTLLTKNKRIKSYRKFCMHFRILFAHQATTRRSEQSMRLKV